LSEHRALLPAPGDVALERRELERSEAALWPVCADLAQAESLSILSDASLARGIAGSLLFLEVVRPSAGRI